MKLYHFTAAEFRRGGTDWGPLMHTRLLVILDLFRFRWGAAVHISPHAAALGRRLGAGVLSDHNVDVHGTVNAADVMPDGMVSRADAERAVRLAIEVGATAIGVYPHWQPGAGLHLAHRAKCRPGAPALWGAVKRDGRQVYTSIDEALEVMR